MLLLPSPAGPDAALGAQYAGKLNILTAPITNAFDSQKTTWVTALAAGQSWSQAATGLVVRVSSMGGGCARLTVCRKGGAETAATCAAGTDRVGGKPWRVAAKGRKAAAIRTSLGPWHSQRLPTCTSSRCCG